MIQFEVENKNGVYSYSNSFEINDTVKIRIIIIHPVQERNPLTYIVKKISNKDENVHFDDSATASSGQCSTVNDLRTKVFINNTNDLKFELLENSKILVMLLFKEDEPKRHYYIPPQAPTFNNDVEFEKPKKIQFEVERIDGVIKFTPEKLDVNMHVSFARIISSNDKTQNEVPFKYKDIILHDNRLDPYGNPHYINQFELGKLFIDDISEFNFDQIPDKIKLTVQLFEHRKIIIPKDTLKNYK